MTDTNDEDIITRLLRENEELKSALQAEKEKERNNPPGEVTDYIQTFKECVQRIEDKFEKMQDNFQKKLDDAGKENLQKFKDLQKQMTNVEDSISMFSQPYSQYVQHWLNSLCENGNVKA